MDAAAVIVVAVGEVAAARAEAAHLGDVVVGEVAREEEVDVVRRGEEAEGAEEWCLIARD